MAKRPTVPKFGTWDSDNVGYTIYFDKVRENKGATAPPLHRPANPNDPVEGPLMAVPPPSSSRPATTVGHRDRPGGQGHRRTGSNSSDPGGRGAEQSKFAPPPQFHQRQTAPAPAPHHHGGGHHHAPPGTHGGGHHRAPSGTHGGGHHHAPSGSHAGGGGGGGHRGHHHQQQRHVAPASRARSASPQKNAPQGRQRPSAVPKFGVWDEQSASAAAQGFTVQFENVKRHREVARAGVPNVPRAPSPPPPPPRRRSHHRDPFMSKMFGCFLPSVKN